MKRFTAFLIILTLILSALGGVTALAGSATVSFGSTKPVAGKTITYSVSVTATASSIGVTSITCSGVFSGSSSTAWKDSSTGTNQKITASGSIKVKVSSSAKPGDTGTIKVSYQISTFDGTNVSSYSGSQSKNYTVVAAATTTAPAKTTSTVKTSSTPAPSATLGEWDIAEQNISGMQQGGSLSADISNSSLMPAVLFSSLKEKQGAFTADFGAYRCTIDGSKLVNIPGSGSIDLSLKMDKDESLSTAVNGQDVYQLHFTEQQLPGILTYSFKADKSNPGDTLYLYCYYSSGVIEGIESATVNTDGTVSFPIYHFSTYFAAASPIPNTAGVDFTAKTAADQSAQAIQSQQADLKNQLKDAQNEASSLKTQLQGVQSQLDGVREQNAQSLSVPTVALIAALCGAAVLAAFLTMLLGRVGIFKKRDADKEHRFEL